MKDNWCTPPEIVELVSSYFDGKIDLDPCSNEESIVPATVKLTKEQDGLAHEWRGYVYANHPFGRGQAKKWLAKAKGSDNAVVITLTKFDPSTNWWNAYAWDADAICVPAKRIKFLGAPSGADFPVALLLYRGNTQRFSEVFSKLGKVLVL